MATALTSTSYGQHSALDEGVTVNGAAGPGSIVKVTDRFGRDSVFELLAQPDPEPRQRVTLSSPVGRALLGARPGDCVHVTLSNGRRRRFRVIDVTPVHAAQGRSVGAG
jgi:transcription elongation GreA/GreB family factor